MPQSLSVGPNFPPHKYLTKTPTRCCVHGVVGARGGGEPPAAFLLIKMHGDFSLIPGHPGYHAYTLSAIGSEQVPFDHMICSERKFIARIACDVRVGVMLCVCALVLPVFK